MRKYCVFHKSCYEFFTFVSQICLTFVRIIEAVTKRLEIPMEKVMVNIEHYGNTSAASIALALWDIEKKLKKGDNVIFTAFGAGFVHGASYIKWGYDGDKVGVNA